MLVLFFVRLILILELLHFRIVVIVKLVIFPVTHHQWVVTVRQEARRQMASNILDYHHYAIHHSGQMCSSFHVWLAAPVRRFWTKLPLLPVTCYAAEVEYVRVYV